MKNQYPEKRDSAPKRRKAQDNPYELFTVGIHTEHPHFFAQFIDDTGEMRCVEVSRSIYTTLDRFELDDLSFLNEVDNHYEHSELTESSLHQRATRRPQSVEETVMAHIQSEILHKALPRFLKSSAAVWCCTTSETIPMSRLEKWRAVPIKRLINQ